MEREQHELYEYAKRLKQKKGCIFILCFYFSQFNYPIFKIQIILRLQFIFISIIRYKLKDKFMLQDKFNNFNK
jgi:hypothetical protein